MKRVGCGALALAMVAMLAGCGHTHTPVADAAVAATCTQSGIEGGIRCATCNKVLVQGHEVEATGHVPVIDPAVPATSDAPGRTEGSHCSVCKEVIVAQTIIEKTEAPAGNTQTNTQTNTGSTQIGIPVRVSNPNEAIYAGPGYAYSYVAAVGAAGTYTIVDQKWDNMGNLWGKLKSGLGWINLAGTEVRTQTQTQSQPQQSGLQVRVSDANQGVYNGPGYGYSYQGTVGKATVYTIVEQRWDSVGNLWGKLKSGAGWINLTEVALRSYN